MPTPTEQIANSNLAAAMVALAGVSELIKELKPTIGHEAANRIAQVMVDRLDQFQAIDGFAETVRKEIRERSESL